MRREPVEEAVDLARQCEACRARVDESGDGGCEIQLVAGRVEIAARIRARGRTRLWSFAISCPTSCQRARPAAGGRAGRFRASRHVPAPRSTTGDRRASASRRTPVGAACGCLPVGRRGRDGFGAGVGHGLRMVRGHPQNDSVRRVDAVGESGRDERCPRTRKSVRRQDSVDWVDHATSREARDGLPAVSSGSGDGAPSRRFRRTTLA